MSPLHNGCSNVNNTEHGTAVAEIVHQMAPSASCSSTASADTTGFRQAEQDIVSRGIPIREQFPELPGDSRGERSGRRDLSGRDRPGRPQGRGALDRVRWQQWSRSLERDIRR